MSNPFTTARPPAYRSVPVAYLLAALLAFVSGSHSAAAADMPMSNMPMKNMAMKAEAAPVYQWSGCYAGLNGGGGAGSSNFTTTVGAGTFLLGGDPAEVTNDGTGSHNNTNVLGGGQAGCNWQSGTVVAGLEGDFDYFRSTSAFFNNTNTLPTSGNAFVIGQSMTTNYLATVRPRIGIAADRNFAYITGGVAFTDASYTESYADAGGGAGGCRGVEIPHRLGRGRRLGICLDRSLDSSGSNICTRRFQRQARPARSPGPAAAIRCTARPIWSSRSPAPA